MPSVALRQLRLLAVTLLALGVVVMLGVTAPTRALAQAVCVEGTANMTCPLAASSDQVPPQSVFASASYPVSYSTAAPLTTVVMPTTVVPPETIGGVPVVTAGPESYLSPGGSYCTLAAGGGQVFVPNGASPADYGCYRSSDKVSGSG